MVRAQYALDGGPFRRAAGCYVSLGASELENLEFEARVSFHDISRRHLRRTRYDIFDDDDRYRHGRVISECRCSQVRRQNEPPSDPRQFAEEKLRQTGDADESPE